MHSGFLVTSCSGFGGLLSVLGATKPLDDTLFGERGTEVARVASLVASLAKLKEGGNLLSYVQSLPSNRVT